MRRIERIKGARLRPFSLPFNQNIQIRVGAPSSKLRTNPLLFIRSITLIR